MGQAEELRALPTLGPQQGVQSKIPRGWEWVLLAREAMDDRQWCTPALMSACCMHALSTGVWMPPGPRWNPIPIALGIFSRCSLSLEGCYLIFLMFFMKHLLTFLHLPEALTLQSILFQAGKCADWGLGGHRGQGSNLNQGSHMFLSGSSVTSGSKLHANQGHGPLP